MYGTEEAEDCSGWLENGSDDVAVIVCVSMDVRRRIMGVICFMVLNFFVLLYETKQISKSKDCKLVKY